jgi:D-beta-D-heptose 7-phosphate kinase / D-beta-D-heptose 1-phosphate adenosyltransferase
LAAVTPNAAEAAGALGEPEPATVADLAGTAERLAASWGSPAVVTDGARGALIAAPPAPVAFVPTTPVPGDTCGAGDCFSAALTIALGRGRDLHDATVAAVAAAGRYVGSETTGVDAERAEVPRLTPPGPTTDGDIPGPDSRELAAEVRAGGGTVVAAGGCFDLLHPGHLRTLEAARALGDCLIICLNGDASVRRLKGPGRPVNPATDRARLLLGLSCVDAVTVFDEDTPVAALETIRPQVFVKGGDYVGMEIAEADVLATWGGRVVVLPLVAGRSTTRMIQRAARRATGRPA